MIFIDDRIIKSIQFAVTHLDTLYHSLSKDTEFIELLYLMDYGKEYQSMIDTILLVIDHLENP